MSKKMLESSLAETTTNDPRWQSLIKRDSSADGKFFYSVKTTGVFCRPSCAARLPMAKNVQFHLTVEDAERSGFRPCKRCQPTQTSLTERNTEKIAQACRMIEKSEKVPTLAKLASAAGMSLFHFHRTFKSVTGVTPYDYARARRARRVRSKLIKSQSVTDAIYDSGFNSNSRFYETSNAVLGMTPSNFRAGGANTNIHFAIGECSLGSILVAQSERGVCAILIGDDPELLVQDLQDKFPHAHLVGNEAQYEDLVAKVVGLVEKPALGLELPLDIQGTAFQQRVWKALREIPVGTTASYTDIAKRIGAPRAFRAVAQACSANALAVAIPCHRVVRSDGNLSGYRWGIERKRTLIAREVRT